MKIENLETERLNIQSSLDSQKTQKARNMLGQFATPTDLASSVLKYAKQFFDADEKINFLDPALGTGSFYSALLRVFPSDAIIRARGFEIDPHYGLPALNLWQSTKLELRLEDFLAQQFPTPSEQSNLIICNPPYVRHHHIEGSEKARLSEKTVGSVGLSLSGLAGLYCHFMTISHSWLSPHGIGGWLVPSEFMDVNYGNTIRRYLTEAVELIHIHRFDPKDMQFGDAQVSSAVVWFRKRKPRANHTVKFSFGGSLEKPLRSRDISVAELRGSQKWSGLVFGERDVLTSSRTLSDYFRIKRGLATGNNKFFVLREDELASLSVPRRFVKPLIPSPRYLDGDLIDSDNNGNPVAKPRLYLIDCSLSEDDLQRESPSLYSYLKLGQEDVCRTYICSRRSPWYRQEARPPAPIICTYMGRGLSRRERPFRFIRNRSQGTALNVYLLLYPTPLLEESLRQDPDLIDVIWERLNQVPAAALLGEGRVYGGGLYKMEPKELANLPADFIEELLSADAREQRQRVLFPSLAA